MNLKKSLIASMLIVCIVINCVSVYRLAVYANPIVVGEIAVEVGELVYEVAPEAVAFFAGLVGTAGAQPKDSNTAAKSTKAYLEYILQDCKTDAEVKATLEKYGFAYSGNGVITVNEDDIYTYVITPSTANSSNYYSVEKSINSKVYTDTVNSAGEKVKSGVKVSYDVLVNNGAAMYDWLHSAEAGFEYVSPMVADISSYDDIRSWYCDWQNAILNSYFGQYYNYSFELGDSCNLSVFDSSNFTNYSYIDVYFDYYPNYDYVSKVYSNCVGATLFAVSYHNSDNSKYHIFTRSDYVLYDSSTGSISRNDSGWGAIFNDISGSKANSSLSYSDALSSAVGFGVAQVSKRISAADLTQIAHYVNSSATDYDENDIYDTAVSGGKTITNGDIDLGLAEGTDVADTVWSSPTALTTAVSEAGALSAEDEAVVLLPGIVDGTEDLDYDKDMPVVLNPDTVDVSTATPSAVTSSDNILDWIKDFFKNFFDRLSSCLKALLLGLFTISDTFLDFWYNKFDACFSAKGYNFDFSFLNKASETSIDDIYITWKGIKILFIPSKYIYSCAEVARPLIRALIYLLILIHDRKRLIYVIRGTVPPENDIEKGG